VAQLTLMERYHQRARAFFDQVTEPQRAAQTEKFFNSIDVACMLAKLKGAMYSALFEHTLYLAKKSTDETVLNSLMAISDHADRAYREARRSIDCAKLGSTCFEMWHNQSLVHLQLAEKHAAFALQVGSGNMSPQNSASAENALKKAKTLYALAGVETDKLAAIPPRFAFVLDRKRSVEQGLLHLKSIQLLLRRQQFSSAVDQALNTPGNHNTSAWLTDSLQNVHNDLSDLLLQVEDSYGNLGTEYCDFELFNLHQEAYALRFNLANLFFKTALETYQSSIQNGRLETQKKQIALQLQTATYWLQEARISLEFLQRSKKASPSALEQRQVQINKLTRSITEFTAAL
jgi:hypothetical protein